MSALASGILGVIGLSGILGVYLLYRQAAAVAANRLRIPAGFEGTVTPAQHERAADYTLANVRFEIAETIYDTFVSLAWLALWLGPLHALVAHWLGPGVTRDVAIVVCFMLIGRVIRLPFSIFKTFWLEARFGFNRVTPAIFMADRVKSLVLAGLLGIPLLYGFFFLLSILPNFWWLIGWIAVMLLMIAMMVIFPAVIDPLFNKFKPLPQDALKARIEALLNKCGFESNGLFVMDASRRSTHANAYFTGFGKAKRIVFFDTLLQNHTPDEIVSILAHELGHYKLGHIRRRLALTAILTLAGFGALYWAFAVKLSVYFGLPLDAGLTLIVFIIAAGPILHLLSPLMSFLSRRAEYQADGFAKSMAGAEGMISALAKLARDNLSTLTPDAFYALFYYSHPPIPDRISRLRA